MLAMSRREAQGRLSSHRFLLDRVRSVGPILLLYHPGFWYLFFLAVRTPFFYSLLILALGSLGVEISYLLGWS